MSNAPTIHNARDYVNYVFNISARGASEVTSEVMGVSNTVQNVLGNLAFKTSEYLSHAESAIISFGVAAAGAYIGATKRAIDFQQATANVEAISGKQLIGSEVGEQAMEMSNKFGMAIEDMTSGLESLARAGITAQSSVNALLESGTQMAKFEGTDLESTMDDLISTVNLLTPEIDTNSEEYAKRVAELNQHIISTSESSPINAQNIINSLQHVGGYASSANIDQDDLFAVIAQMGSKGTKGEITGTSLRAFVSAGQKDTAQRALNRVGLNVTDLWDDTGESMLSISQMKDVLDQAMESKGYTKQQKLEFYSDFVGYKQANQIMKINTKEVEHYRQAIDGAMSVTDKMGITLGTVQGNWAQIRNTAINFMTKVGSKLLPVINAILVPVKMIVSFIDKIPFADWAVAGGLILLTTQGIAKGIQVLVPTIMTFIYKFTILKKESFSIKNIFSQWHKDLKLAKKTLADMTNRDAMEKIVNDREAKKSDKHLKHLNEQDAIDEIMRQKFGTKEDKNNKTYYVWDKLGTTEQTYYRTKFRPPEDLIEKMVEHRENAMDRTWQRLGKGANTPASEQTKWPTIDDVGGENYKRSKGINFNVSSISTNVSDIYSLLSNWKNQNTSKQSDSSSQPNVSYGESNRTRNKKINNIFDGTKSDRKYGRAIINPTFSGSGHTPKEAITSEDIIRNIEHFYEHGSIKLDNSTTIKGASNAATGQIRLNQDYYDDIFQTTAHEIAHIVAANYLRSTVHGSPKGKPLHTGKHTRRIDGYKTTEDYAGEAEANIVERVFSQASNINGHRLNNQYPQFDSENAFLAQLRPDEDINLELINTIIEEMISNPQMFMPFANKVKKANPLAGGIFQAQIKGMIESQETLKKFKDTGVSFDEFLGTDPNKRFMKEAQLQGDNYADYSADVFDLAPATAAVRILEEKRRMQRKLEEWKQPGSGKPIMNEKGELELPVSDVLVNAYKKNLTTAAMTQEGKQFAIEKNQRQLFDFLNNGLINVEGKSGDNINDYIKGNLIKKQWTTIQDKFNHATYNTDRGPMKDTFLRGFANLRPDAFIKKYQNLKRDADKVRVMNALLQYGAESASDLLNTRTEVNLVRKRMVKTGDYSLINKHFGLDLSGNNDQKYAQLQDWFNNEGKGKETEVARLLAQEHERPLLRTIETNSRQDNITLLKSLQNKGYNVDDILNKYKAIPNYGNYKMFLQLQKQLFEKDEAGNYLSDNQQKIVQDAKKILGGWSDLGKVAQYELSLHFEEINKLAERAGISVNDTPRPQLGVGMIVKPKEESEEVKPKEEPEEIKPQEPTTPPKDKTTIQSTLDNFGNPPIPYGYDPDNNFIMHGPLPVPYTSDVTDYINTATEDPRITRLQNILEIYASRIKMKFNARILDFFGYEADQDRIGDDGNGSTGRTINPTNRFMRKLYEKIDPHAGEFNTFVDKATGRVNKLTDSIGVWSQALAKAGGIFPPFTAAAIALQGVISGLETGVSILNGIVTTLNNMQTLSGVFSMFKNNALLSKLIPQLGGKMEALLGAFVSGIANTIIPVIAPLIAPLAAIAAVILAITAALKLSQDSHDKYLKQLQEENKTIRAEDKANQATYNNLRRRRRNRSYGMTRTNRDYINRQYELAEQRLHASQVKRHANVIKMAKEERDVLWGTYSARAGVQKIPILNLLTGEFKSTASDYSGTSEQIRKIKEHTVANPFATGAQRQAAAYYDAHQPAFAMLDEYKSELGELYDKETKYIRIHGSREAARNNKMFQKAVNEFSESTGINKETAYQMLDWMQTEHAVEQASKQMQARADVMASEAEMKALAIEYGASVDDVMGLNGQERMQEVMVKAQADMIKEEVATRLWWQGTWKTIEQLFWTIVSPVTLIVSILGMIFWAVKAIMDAVTLNWGEVGSDVENFNYAAQNAGDSLRDMSFFGGKKFQQGQVYYGAHDDIRKADLAGEGKKNLHDERDRADYGSGGKPLSVPTGGQVPKSTLAYQERTDARYAAQSQVSNQLDNHAINQMSNNLDNISNKADRSERVLHRVDSGDGIFGLLKNHALFKKSPDLIDLLLGKYKRSGKSDKDKKDDTNWISGIGVAASSLSKNIDQVIKGASKGVKAIYKTIKNSEKLYKIYSNLKEMNFSHILEDVKNFGHRIFTGELSIEKIWNKIKSPFSKIKDGLRNIYKKPFSIKGFIDSIRNKMQPASNSKGFWGKIQSFLFGEQQAGTVGKDGIPEYHIKAGLKQNIEAILSKITTMYKTEGLTGFKDITKNIGGNIFNNISSAFKNFIFGEQVPGLTQGVYATKGGLIQNLKAIFSKLKGSDGLIPNIKAAFSKIMDSGLTASIKDEFASANPMNIFKDAKGIFNEFGIAKNALKAGESTVAKTAFKEIGKYGLDMLAPIGYAIEIAEDTSKAYAKHNPSKKHYDKDGKEKSAVQEGTEFLLEALGPAGGMAVGAGTGGWIGGEAGSLLGPEGTAIGAIIGTFIGAILGPEAMRTAVDTFEEPIGEIVDYGFKGIKESSKNLFNMITLGQGNEALDIINEKTGGGISTIKDTINDFINNPTDKKFINPLGTFLESHGIGVDDNDNDSPYFKNIFGNNEDAAKNAGDSIFNAAQKDNEKSANNAWSNITESANQQFNNMIKNVNDTFGGAIGNISNWLHEGVGWLNNTLNGAGEWLQGATNNTLTWISDTLNGAWTSFWQTGAQYWQYLTEWASGTLGWISEWLGNIGGFFQGIIDGIKNAIIWVLEKIPGDQGESQLKQLGTQQSTQAGTINQANAATQTQTKQQKPGYFATHQGFTNYSSGADSMPDAVHQSNFDIAGGNTTNLSDYQPSTSNGNRTNFTRSKDNNNVNNLIGGDSSSINIENININTNDDPERIKTALMSTVIELQEEISPRLVSRTIGEAPSSSSDIESNTNLKEDASKNQNNNTNNNSNNTNGNYSNVSRG